MAEIDYLSVGMKAFDLVVTLIDAAQAANDDAAVANLEKYIRDSSVGARLVARGERAQAVADAGQERIRLAAEAQARARARDRTDTPVLGIPVALLPRRCPRTGKDCALRCREGICIEADNAALVAAHPAADLLVASPAAAPSEPKVAVVVPLPRIGAVCNACGASTDLEGGEWIDHAPGCPEKARQVADLASRLTEDDGDTDEG